MDTDLFTNLLKGQGSGDLLTSLLPILLGGKRPELGSLLGGMLGKKAPEESYPPLFGEKTSEGPNPPSMLSLLQHLIPSAAPTATAPAPVPQYPYELQYNRPFIRKMHK